MDSIKLCVVCLNSNVKLYKCNELTSYYEDIVQNEPSSKEFGVDLTYYFCYECTALLQKYHKFRKKCFKAKQILHEGLWNNSITNRDLDRSTLRSTLDYSKPNHCYIGGDEISDVHKFSDDKPDLIEEMTCNDGKPIKQEINIGDDDYDSIDDVFGDNEVMINQDDEVKDTVFVQIKKEVEQLIKNSKRLTHNHRAKRDIIKKTKKNKHSKKTHGKLKKGVLSEHWKSYILNEEDAIKEFNDKCLDEKYLKATFKCEDCYRPFSKEEMFVRHRDLKHAEGESMLECNLCKYRFRYHWQMRRHMRPHYARYKCLRCDFNCSLESTATFHDQYHNGVIWICKYCNEEFRHSSTYYSHVRVVHRSEFVCSRCGVSFVSRAGLHQHTKIKHYQELWNKSAETSISVLEELSNKSAENLVESKTHCERCDVRFDTEGAYLEHILHSLLHEDDSSKTANQGEGKSQGLRLKARVTEVVRRRIRSRKSKKESKAADYKKHSKPASTRKCREMFKKPTTCYQCGEHFSTQTLFTRHHISVHPRTSAVPPESRTICELCGISLAPGSVTAHQNLHNKAHIYSCATCGRQFYTNESLKRHTLTHTGEKPWACSLCDKRFTQSNSMKLHYRTFHLKEPYPKRNRKKKIADIPPEVNDLSAEVPARRPEYINM